jgi:hypothetical protein
MRSCALGFEVFTLLTEEYGGPEAFGESQAFRINIPPPSSMSKPNKKPEAVGKPSSASTGFSFGLLFPP